MKRQVRDKGSKPDCAETLELHLAVAIGEEGEHEERKPVRRRLIECTEHARRIGVAGAAAQKIVCFFTSVATEIFLQEINHCPEVAALFDVDLEEIAHVVERRRGLAEMALLLDGSGFGVALDDDQAAQHGAIFAGHFLPRRLALVLAEIHLPSLFLRRKQHAPAIFRHAHVIELRPAFRIDTDRGAQIDKQFLKTFRTHVVPPIEIAGMPAFERLQHLAVAGQIDVVRDFRRVVDVEQIHLDAPRNPAWPL